MPQVFGQEDGKSQPRGRVGKDQWERVGKDDVADHDVGAKD
jgi:hypothetical protein